MKIIFHKKRNSLNNSNVENNVNEENNFVDEYNKFSDIIKNIKHNINPNIEEILIENNIFYNKVGFINQNNKEKNMNKKI